MIGRIRGKLIEKKVPYILIDVGGVGYEIVLPLMAFNELPVVGSEISLFTHFCVREDEQSLFGFIGENDRAIFRQLIKVTGIGPKTALGILSSITPDLLIRYVIDDNLTLLSKLPGIGKKTAQRLVMELRDKLMQWQGSGGENLNKINDGNVSSDDTVSVVQDAIGALIALGYKPNQSREIVFKIKKEKENVNSAELIRLALKEL